MTIRIGNGFDVHALVAGRRLVLGRVTIPYERGLEGHSDADVLLHAIADAILGALAQGDIGTHFPDTDARWKGADSRVLLRHTRQLLADAGWRVVNVDSTVIAQQPKLAAHIPAMVANIAADLGLGTLRGGLAKWAIDDLLPQTRKCLVNPDGHGVGIVVRIRKSGRSEKKSGQKSRQNERRSHLSPLSEIRRQSRPGCLRGPLRRPPGPGSCPGSSGVFPRSSS